MTTKVQTVTTAAAIYRHGKHRTANMNIVTSSPWTVKLC